MILQTPIREKKWHAKVWKAEIVSIQTNNKIFCYKPGDYVERTKEDLIVLVIILIMIGYQFDETVKNANAILKH